jgi:hypothetical protein
MPRINKSKLLSVVDQAQSNVDERMKQYEKARDQYYGQRSTEWEEEILPRWSEFATLIRDRVKRKKVITEKDAHNIFPYHKDSHFLFLSRYHAVPFWQEYDSPSFTIGGITYNKPKLDPRLDSLRSLLETIVEDEFSTSALADLGWRNLSWLYEAALKTD